MRSQYHTELASYFQSKPLYLDGEDFKKPNVRKLVEQPWQQTKGESWDEVKDTLTDFLFIEANVRSKLIESLSNDYEFAINQNNESSIKKVNINRLFKKIQLILLRNLFVLKEIHQNVFTQLLPDLLYNKTTKSTALRWISETGSPFISFEYKSQNDIDNWKLVKLNQLNINFDLGGAYIYNNKTDTILFIIDHERTKYRVGRLQFSSFNKCQFSLINEEFEKTKFDYKSFLSLHHGFHRIDTNRINKDIYLRSVFYSNYEQIKDHSYNINLLVTEGLLIVHYKNGSSKQHSIFKDRITAKSFNNSNLILCGSASGELRSLNLENGLSDVQKITNDAITNIYPIENNNTFLFTSEFGMLGLWQYEDSISLIQTPHKSGIKNLIEYNNRIITIGKRGQIFIWSLPALINQKFNKSFNQRSDSVKSFIDKSSVSPSGHALLITLKERELLKQNNVIAIEDTQSHRAKQISKLRNKYPGNKLANEWYEDERKFILYNILSFNKTIYDKDFLFIDFDNSGNLLQAYRNINKINFKLNNHIISEIPALGTVIEDYYFSPNKTYLFIFFRNASGFILLDLSNNKHKLFPIARKHISFSNDNKKALVSQSNNGLVEINLKLMSSNLIIKSGDYQDQIQCYSYANKMNHLVIGTAEKLYLQKYNNIQKRLVLANGNFIQCGIIIYPEMIWAITNEGNFQLFNQENNLLLEKKSVKDFEISLTQQYIVFINISNHIEIFDISILKIVFEYGFENIVPKVHFIADGIVFIYEEGDIVITKMQRFKN